MPLLALFDVDGTLFLTDDPLSSEALLATLASSTRSIRPRTPSSRSTIGGRRRSGSPGSCSTPTASTSRRRRAPGRMLRRFAARYVTMLAAADTSAWQAAPGAAEALTRLQDAGVRLALADRQPRADGEGAHVRLGLERSFPEGEGAFGCESESRIELIELARRPRRRLARGADRGARRHATRRDNRSCGRHSRRPCGGGRSHGRRRAAAHAFGLDFDPWRRRPHCRPDSSSRSSRGCRGSARSTRSRSRSARPPLAKRSIKRESKVFALELAVRMIDLTTLEGADTPGKVAALCLEGGPARPVRPERALGRRGLRLPEPRPDGGRARARHRRQGRVRRDRVPVRPVAARAEGRRGALGRRARRGRGRHGDRPRRVPRRAATRRSTTRSSR